MKQAAFQLFFLFLIVSSLYAGQLNLQVTVSQGTFAVGTNVTLVSGGVEVESKKADQYGNVSFNVSDGSYFVLLRRYPYPLHVSLIEVVGNTTIPLTMRLPVSYASAYGQIYGPANFSEASVAAYSQGEIVRRIRTNKDGFYMLSFLPQGSYQIVFSSPGYQEKKVDVFLPEAEPVYLEARLDKIVPVLEPAEEIKVPRLARQFSEIEISIFKGENPVFGELIEVQTPAGEINISTGEDGKARINAAEAGEYLFKWRNQTFATIVEPFEAPNSPQPKQEEPETPVLPDENLLAEKSGKENQSDILVVLAAVLLAVAFSIAFLFLAVQAFKAIGFEKKNGKKKKKK
ncbi:MAG: carboxypeptidase-like regulatory domain-containing protein [Candidatus Anstonellaceae archaeon]